MRERRVRNIDAQELAQRCPAVLDVHLQELMILAPEVILDRLGMRAVVVSQSLAIGCVDAAQVGYAMEVRHGPRLWREFPELHDRAVDPIVQVSCQQDELGFRLLLDQAMPTVVEHPTDEVIVLGPRHVEVAVLQMIERRVLLASRYAVRRSIAQDLHCVTKRRRACPGWTDVVDYVLAHVCVPQL